MIDEEQTKCLNAKWSVLSEATGLKLSGWSEMIVTGMPPPS
jgi:hypothetical protein